mgnify:CR=1 FL=1|tara:strand:+ start:301 stop:1089 length:789 start_codon:yes stop_codon:yes gene_type:complete
MSIVKLYKNNAYSTLASAITTSSQTSITLQTGHGDRFPVVNQGGSGTDSALVTLQNSAGTIEIVNIARRDTGVDILTIGVPGTAVASASGRGLESTTATTWAASDVVEQRITAGELGNFATNVWDLVSVAGTNTITGTAPAVVTAYATGQQFYFIAANTITGAATLNVNSLGAKNIYKGSATAVEASDILAGAGITVIYDGTQFQLMSGAGGGAKANGCIYENNTTISGAYTMTSGRNGASVGPITISGSVTLGASQRWVIQ